MVPLFKNVGGRSTAKNYHSFSPASVVASVVSKVSEKLVNNRTVDQRDKFGLFSDFQHYFRSFWLTADLLTVVSHRISGALTGLGLLEW